MNIQVSICDGPVDPAHNPTADGSGSSLTFLGIVRPLEDGRPITGLLYEAYEPMAERVLEDLCRQASQKFAVLALRLVHSRGLVPVGRPSLFVSIEAEHRAAALEAMTWVIDALKKDVPIWKRPA